MSTYAIGDVHGCLVALQTVFEQQDFQKDDLVVFLGDYIDKGPDTKGVLNFLMEQQRKLKLVFLQGNHDQMMLVAKQHPERLNEWLESGGQATLNSYGMLKNSPLTESIPQEHWQFLSDSLPYFELDAFVFVHAGLAKGIPLKDQMPHHLYWEKFYEPQEYLPGKTVICGHTARKNGQIADYGHTVCIDTFAYGGQWLTCLEVETGNFLQTNEQGDFNRGQLE